MEDIVRIIRVIEYRGPRSRVEKTLSESIQGTKDAGNGLFISVATIGSFPEILKDNKEEIK
jgi:hypothetical protein